MPQLGRLFEGFNNRKEREMFLTREITWTIHAYHDKNPKPRDLWWPIKEDDQRERTDEELDKVWQTYGKRWKKN